MKPAPFDYARAESLDEAIGLLAAADGDARPLAGGQSLGPMLNLRIARPALLVDLSPIAELREVSEDEDGSRQSAHRWSIRRSRTARCRTRPAG